MFHANPRRALFLALALLIFALLCTGCKKKQPDASDEGALSTPAADLSAEETAPAANNAADPGVETPANADEVAVESAAPAAAVELKVTQTVANYFPDINGYSQLYGAFEFENTGAEAAYVTLVKMQFRVGDKSFATEFIPMLHEEDIVAPGQKSTLAYWSNFDGSSLNEDTPIEVTVELSGAARPADNIEHPLEVQNLRLLRNYPTFDTLSGSIRNPSPENNYSLSLVYASFYDVNDKLLGVWHFSKNMAIHADTARTFSIQMRTLPIDDLAGQVHRIVGRGIGIE